MSTVKFGSNKKTRTVSLPSYQDGDKNETKVEVKTSRSMAEQRELTKKYPNANDPKHSDAQEATLAMMVDGILKWNFTNEDDTSTEINAENIDSLDDIDFLFLLWEITGQELVKDWKAISKDQVSIDSKNG